MLHKKHGSQGDAGASPASARAAQPKGQSSAPLQPGAQPPADGAQGPGERGEPCKVERERLAGAEGTGQDGTRATNSATAPTSPSATPPQLSKLVVETKDPASTVSTSHLRQGTLLGLTPT